MSLAQSLTIPVDRLHTGLYVHALDRPWVETPLVFQGFRIAGPDELETLRAYCKYVYVDLARSAPEAADAVMAAGKRQPVRPEQLHSRTADAMAERRLPQEVRACTGALFEPVAHPDRARFGRLVQRAAEVHEAAGEAVIAALGRLADNRPVNISRATRAVDGMLRLVRADASPSLWLSRLRRRGDYHADHAASACALALAFGTHLGMAGRALQSLGLGTLLMDVGMVRLPPALLERPRAFSATERAMMRKHVALGCERLQRDGLPAEALAIVRQHHERRDGSGYPAGLAGERIPRQALIAGLADTFDALTSERPYRAACRPEQALQTLYREADASFGQELVAAFIRCIGTYPVGSLVELDNAAAGVVVGSQPGAGPWPTVMLVRTPLGQPDQQRRLLNLAAANEADSTVSARHIRRALAPEQAGIDVSTLVAGAFGLGYAPAETGHA
jgi:HD-GYP domain-containing protein (c-di-GMP phosphodiesterase class II)